MILICVHRVVVQLQYSIILSFILQIIPGINACIFKFYCSNNVTLDLYNSQWNTSRRKEKGWEILNWSTGYIFIDLYLYFCHKLDHIWMYGWQIVASQIFNLTWGLSFVWKKITVDRLCLISCYDYFQRFETLWGKSLHLKFTGSILSKILGGFCEGSILNPAIGHWTIN